MNKRARIAATALALTLGAGAATNRVDSATVAGRDTTPTGEQLTVLGPVELIANQYTTTSALTCDGDAAFDVFSPAGLWPSIPGDVTFTAASETAANSWRVTALAVEGLGLLVFSAVDSSGNCTPGETIAVVTGSLSNDDTYSVTFVVAL